MGTLNALLAVVPRAIRQEGGVATSGEQGEAPAMRSARANCNGQHDQGHDDGDAHGDVVKTKAYAAVAKSYVAFAKIICSVRRD